MARGAVLIVQIGHVVGPRLDRHSAALPPEAAGAVMAFQAKGEHHGPAQESRIGGPVGRMAAFAALNPDRGVLEYERPAFFGVAFQAGFFIRRGLIHHAGTRRHAPSGRRGSVRVVAIGAVHESFVHPVLERH